MLLLTIKMLLFVPEVNDFKGVFSPRNKIETIENTRARKTLFLLIN